MKPRLLISIGAVLAGVIALSYLFFPMSLMAFLGIAVYLHEKI